VEKLSYKADGEEIDVYIIGGPDSFGK